MISTKKYYFLPFLDNLTAVGISFLIIILFGNWLAAPAFSAIATFFMLFTLCGRIYVRMWNLSRRNTRYNYGLTKFNFLKFILPLVIFDLVIIIFYCLSDSGIIPLKNVIVTSYYNFPDDAKRELVQVSLFEYVTPFVRAWFAYLVNILKNSYIFFLAPILSFISAMAGYKLGKDDKQILNVFLKVTQKTKDKFNE